MNKLTAADGTTIAFDVTGDGPPAVIVEGAFCDRRTSAALAARLAERHTVFAYDRRGRGDSADSPQWSVRREVDDLGALLGAAGGAAAVYGMSSGAVLAVEAAAAGAGVTRLALYEPPPVLSGDLAGRLAELVAADRRGDAVEHFLTAAVQLPAEAVAHMRTLPMWAGLSAVAHTLVYDTTITADPTVLSRAATVAVPTLVLTGADSPWFLHESARTMAAAIPGAELRYLDGQTHDVDPAVLAPVLAEFYSSASPEF